MDKKRAIRRLLANRRLGPYTSLESIKKERNDLIKRKKLQRQFFNNKILKEKATLQCFLCSDICLNPTVLSCGHVYCYKCINEHIQKTPVLFEFDFE